MELDGFVLLSGASVDLQQLLTEMLRHGSHYAQHGSLNLDNKPIMPNSAKPSQAKWWSVHFFANDFSRRAVLVHIAQTNSHIRLCSDSKQPVMVEIVMAYVVVVDVVIASVVTVKSQTTLASCTVEIYKETRLAY